VRWLDLKGPEDGSAYLARVDWEDPAHLLVQRLARDQKSLELLRIDVATGRSETVLTETSPTWVDLHDDLRVVEGTGELVWSSERTGFRQLELRDREGKLIRALTRGGDAVDRLVAVDPKRREAWYLAGVPSPLESNLLRVSLDGGEPARLTTEPGMHAVEVAPGFDRFVDTWSTRNAPPRTVLRDRDGKPLRVLHDAASDPRLALYELPPPQLVSFTGPDGVGLYGAYYAPRRTGADGKAPLIVMVYGGPTVQTVTDSWGMTVDLLAQYYTEQGFAVWKCDNRGSSRRGRAFQDPIHRKLGVVEVIDQAAGVAEAARRFPEIDANRVGITGGSYGGYMTLRALELAPEVFHAGVASAPVTFWEGYDTAYTERYMETPSTNAEGYREASVLTHAAKLKGRLMVVHGMIDENVHFRHAARLAGAFLETGQRVRLVPLPEERHGTRRPEARAYVTEEAAAFFREALGVAEPAR
jgi:dipeptidyl-peptidase-4